MQEGASEIMQLDVDSIVVKEIATPATFFKFTSNSNGALYGLASYVHQIKKNVMPFTVKKIAGLYLVGHWSTQGYAQGGIPVVALAGRNVAQYLLKNFQHN